jgi:hypothetical protein
MKEDVNRDNLNRGRPMRVAGMQQKEQRRGQGEKLKEKFGILEDFNRVEELMNSCRSGV